MFLEGTARWIFTKSGTAGILKTMKKKAVPLCVLLVIGYYFINMSILTIETVYLNIYKHRVAYSDGVYVSSTCPGRSFERGPGQAVVTFSFYGSINHSRNYFHGIDANARLVATYYPGWIMRVYHNLNYGTEEYNLMKRLEEIHKHLDFCNVYDIFHLGNVPDIYGRLWRFIPMADPLIDIFLSRDLDSRISQREVDAVKEWMDSNLTFHVMRDHPQHYAKILGMWGARVENNRDLLGKILYQIIENGKNYKKDFDQEILGKMVWPFTDGDAIFHDSYLCNTWKNKYWKPFPTRRKKGGFVGSTTENPPLEQLCPQQCRAHEDWITC